MAMTIDHLRPDYGVRVLRDFTDARAMVARGLVEPRRIRDLFAAIEPALIRFPGIDPVEFRVVVDQFCQSHSA